MKKETRLKVFLNKIFKKVTPVDSMDKLEYAIGELEKNYEQLDEKHSKALALKQQIEEKIKYSKDKSKELLSIIETTKDDDVKNKSYKFLKEMEDLYNISSKQLEAQTKIVQNFEDAKDKCDNDRHKATSKHRILKQQLDFAKSVNELKDICGAEIDFKLDDISDEVDIEYKSSIIDLDKIKLEESIDDFVKNDNVSEDFINMVKANDDV